MPEINGLRNILANVGTLHHIHAPGEDGPDDPGADPCWRVEIESASENYPNSLKLLEDLRDTVGWHEVSGRYRGPAIITPWDDD